MKAGDPVVFRLVVSGCGGRGIRSLGGHEALLLVFLHAGP